MASAAEKRRFTPQDYLALERRAETKSEDYNGEIFAMSGASREHNHLAGNFYRAISSQLEDRPREVFVNDMRVKVTASGLYTYPDVVAVCGEAQYEDAEVDTLLTPTLVVEILSPSTERYDRGRKFSHYQRIEALREYVLVSQDAVLVERYTRRGDDWLRTTYLHRDDTLPLDSVGVGVPLRAVYARVDVPDGDEGPDADPANRR